MFKDILKGFAVTAKHLLKKPVTINYPEQRRPQPQWYRGRHRLQRYENGLERCVACALCAAVCPSEAIYLEAAENDPAHPVGAGERYAKVYQIHWLRCIWCGYCEEACPEDAIVMGQEWELANYTRQSLVANKEDMLDPSEKGFGEPPDLKVNTKL